LQERGSVPGERAATEALATDLVRRIRAARDKRSAVDAFTQEYALSSDEGVVLMCLAESLLRVCPMRRRPTD
jgi:RHH-type transcriptional regulator, proline utilization regulon repressor / proline dehydrogenase / delta 1-pyrroline-5-carboxylate dehydrogenase